MQAKKVSQHLLLGLALLMATSAFASNKYSMQISNPVSVSGQSLPAGAYSLSWSGSGPSVQVSIMKGNQVVATAPARLIDLNQKAGDDIAVVKSNGDGTKSLAEVRFYGKKQALSFDENSTTAGGSR